jgi:general L-amino acid transport system permease protein
MTVHVIDPTATQMKPPATRVGVVGWMRANLFNGVFNSILTLLTLLLLWQTVPPLVKWAFIQANWFGSGIDCRNAGGACWAIVSHNLRFIIFGFYPHPQ